MGLATADDLTRWLTVAYCAFGVAALTTFIRSVAFFRLNRSGHLFVHSLLFCLNCKQL